MDILTAFDISDSGESMDRLVDDYMMVRHNPIGDTMRALGSAAASATADLIKDKLSLADAAASALGVDQVKSILDAIDDVNNARNNGNFAEKMKALASVVSIVAESAPGVSELKDIASFTASLSSAFDANMTGQRDQVRVIAIALRDNPDFAASVGGQINMNLQSTDFSNVVGY